MRVNIALYWLGLEQTQLKTFAPIHQHKVRNALKKKHKMHLKKLKKRKIDLAKLLLKLL